MLDMLYKSYPNSPQFASRMPIMTYGGISAETPAIEDTGRALAKARKEQ